MFEWTITSLNIAGSEWFIIFIVIIVLILPKKIVNVSKSLGKVVGEYEKTRRKIMDQKNMILPSSTQTSINAHEYKGPLIQRPISSERQKLEIIAKSLNINPQDILDEELRNQISSKLRKN